ncbi:MAG: SDR family NAD(P)-dependent oxidoreductase [Gemmatimonadetes bacterium]|nr:SDR family NAD(P)-dependent oxidoreductase [Gemmatimonadota bacterium]
MSRLSFDGRAVVLTGASRGIGLSIARELARRGAHLALVARQSEGLELCARLVREEVPGCHTLVLPADVSNPAAIHEVVQRAAQHFGGLGGVVCNAGLAHPGYFEQLPADVFERLCAVNYLGAVHTVRAALPHIQREGFIALTSSVLGYMGAFGHTAYAGTKFALVGFAECLRQELLQREIHVAVLCPPDTDTPGFAVERAMTPPETAALSANAGLMRADDVARRFVRALERRSFLINVNLSTAVFHRAHRWFPSLTRAVMDRMVLAAQQRSSRGRA